MLLAARSHELPNDAGFRVVEEHNARVPHAAFEGQTPDEVYRGTGGHVPGELVAARADDGGGRCGRRAENSAIPCQMS